MKVDFLQSETKLNLLRAFAGESQARNRYTFGAETAKNSDLHLLEEIFNFTANQEKEHAEIFYNHLKEAAGENITIEAAYPVKPTEDMVALLQSSHHNEYEEWEQIYPAFGDTAEQEGFLQIADSFRYIAEIEKIHGDRFQLFGELLAEKKLFVSDVSVGWICLNCGHVLYGTQAPQICPVCSHSQGYFVRLDLAPFTCSR